MTEVPVPQVDLLQPGNIFELSDITELAAFEGLVAPEVDPFYNHILWQSRLPLKELIRPPKFNGTIANIKLTVMNNPYDRLLDANQRGWKFKSRAQTHKLQSDISKAQIPNYRGFVFTGDAKSSGRGTIGQVQAEIWYYPLPKNLRIDPEGKLHIGFNTTKSGERRYYSYTNKKDIEIIGAKAYGEAMRRIVTMPKLEAEKFIALNETARRIGFAVLRDALSHQISTPMQE